MPLELSRHSWHELAVYHALIHPTEFIGGHETIEAFPGPKVVGPEAIDHGGCRFHLPGAFASRFAIENLDHTAGVRARRVDFVFRANPPEARLAVVCRYEFAFMIELPRAGLVGQIVLPIMGKR